MLIVVGHGRSQTTATPSVVVLFYPWMRVDNSGITDLTVYLIYFEACFPQIIEDNVCSCEACQWSQVNDKQMIYIL